MEVPFSCIRICQCQVSFDLPFLRSCCIVLWSLFPSQQDNFCTHQGPPTNASRKGKSGDNGNRGREKERNRPETKEGQERTQDGKLEAGSDQSDKATAQQERRRVFTYLLAWRTRLPSSRKAWQLACNCSFCSSCSALLSCTVLACGPST